MGKIYAFVILAVCVITIVKSADAKMSKPISIICAILPLCAAVPYMAEIVKFVKDTAQGSGIGTLVYLPLIMICGDLLSSVCADIGEKALSESIVLVTRIMVIAAMTGAMSRIVTVIGGILK